MDKVICEFATIDPLAAVLGVIVFFEGTVGFDISAIVNDSIGENLCSVTLSKRCSIEGSSRASETNLCLFNSQGDLGALC